MTRMLVLPRDREWTVDDLRHLPDDGLQYELADGLLLVTPAPNVAHQRAVGRLHRLLAAGCPPPLEVFVAPLDYQPSSRRSLQPDLLVAGPDSLDLDAVRGPLAVAVEVLSLSTRAKDLLLKRDLYADSGVEAYWVVDLDVPWITGWTLRNRQYVYEVRAVGEEVFQPERPFPLRVVPASLL